VPARSARFLAHLRLAIPRGSKRLRRVAADSL